MTRRSKSSPSQVGIPVGRLHLEDTVTDVEDGDVEGSTTKVENGDLFLRLAIQAVGQGCCRGFVDDAHDIQPGDAPGVFGGLTLAVAEIGGNRDHRIRHGSPRYASADCLISASTWDEISAGL
jgi:hypothetical protein